MTTAESRIKNNQSRNEIIYQMTMATAKTLVQEGLLTRDMYDQFHTQMVIKYSPVFGGLFYELD